ncbi:hypothetical protein ACFLY6_00235 [Candidatus Dependentiae bacterium]
MKKMFFTVLFVLSVGVSVGATDTPSGADSSSRSELVQGIASLGIVLGIGAGIESVVAFAYNFIQQKPRSESIQEALKEALKVTFISKENKKRNLIRALCMSCALVGGINMLFQRRKGESVEEEQTEEEEEEQQEEEEEEEDDDKPGGAPIAGGQGDEEGDDDTMLGFVGGQLGEDETVVGKDQNGNPVTVQTMRVLRHSVEPVHDGERGSEKERGVEDSSKEAEDAVVVVQTAQVTSKDEAIKKLAERLYFDVLNEDYYGFVRLKEIATGIITEENADTLLAYLDNAKKVDEFDELLVKAGGGWDEEHWVFDDDAEEAVIQAAIRSVIGKAQEST